MNKKPTSEKSGGKPKTANKTTSSKKKKKKSKFLSRIRAKFKKKPKKKKPDRQTQALTAKQDMSPAKTTDNPSKVKKKRFIFHRMTQNEVENLFTLPPDDDVFEEETRLVTNRYYLTLSDRFRWATWITVIVLGAYLAVMFFSFRNEITLDNFRFLMRNVNFRIESTLPLPEDQSGVIYDRDKNRIFTLYKDYFATVGNGRLAIVDKNGNQSLNEALDYASPSLRSSDSQLLCFDKGGKSYSLYTYFNLVWEKTLEYPITDGAIADNGNYALATREGNYYGVVMVYNSESDLIQRIRKDKYIVSIDLLPDGSEILVTSFYTDEQGRPVTEIAAHPTASTEAASILTFENTLPYECSYLPEGGCVLIGSDGVKFIDSKWKIYSTSTFSGQNVIKYDTGDDFIALLSASETDTTDLTLTCVLFDGSTLRCKAVGGSPVLCGIGNGVCLASSGNLYILSAETGKLTTVEGIGQPQAILWDSEQICLCMNTRIVRVNTDGTIDNNN